MMNSLVSKFIYFFECNMFWSLIIMLAEKSCLILQADTNKDGRLSLQEMIEHPYVFYSAIFSEDDDDGDFNDEFR